MTTESDLTAAREEGRREGLREAIAHCESKFEECTKCAMAIAASRHGSSNILSHMTERATLYMAIAGELEEKL